ncbi:MAG: 50S ribosomal protein L28 [Elusimicrobiota bacterium]|jgi:large subunit ribosomal protein L28|nr:50S ribosomal protein L28 [Elusimicrobiota bacterium]
MSYKCIICGKKNMSGNNVSHSNRKTKRQFKANLQKINILFEGNKQKKLVCTSCIKAKKIQKA